MMRTIMARSPHDSSFSFSKRHFQWLLGKAPSGGAASGDVGAAEVEVEVEECVPLSSASHDDETVTAAVDNKTKNNNKKKNRSVSTAAVAVSRFRSVLVAAVAARRLRPAGLGARVTGTLFGRRRGHVCFALQSDTRASPVALIELAAPTNALVREMASGLVRIALECERKAGAAATPGRRLLEEPLWRAYCNGRKCGYAVRRECGPADWKVLRAVEPVSMGAGVLPGDGGEGAEGEMMYMRARFERVVGSKDSEAFYMMNPDGNGGPELSIYLLRV